LRGTRVILGNAVGIMQYPDVIFTVNGETSDLTDDPVVGQLLGPPWVDPIVR
jgi:hypothetical protein